MISATRGNHGQSIAFAARRQGLGATIVVPHGNSVEKNAAMRALGAELIEHGSDFQQAREHAAKIAGELGLHFVPSFHRDLVRGVASYWVEFFRAVQPAVVFVPVGQGSGICACIAARGAYQRGDAHRRRGFGACPRLSRIVSSRPQRRGPGEYRVGRRHGLPRARRRTLGLDPA